MGIPSATISLSSYNITTGNTSLITVVFSEAVSGFTSSDITVQNGTVGTVGTLDNITYTAVFTPTAGVLDNTNVVSVAAGVCTSVSTSEANTSAVSANYIVNTVTTTIDVSVITEGIIDGNGIFDVFMKAINAHVVNEWEKKRITSDTYPQVYLGAMQTALTQAVVFATQRPLVEKQTDTEAAKKLLIERQTKGFDDDAKQKLMKQMLDSWSVAYSVAKDANSIPDSIKVNPIDSVTKNAMDSLGIIKTNNPLNEA